MSNCCSPDPERRTAYFDKRDFDVQELRKVVEWAKHADKPSIPHPSDPEEEAKWTLNTAWWFFCDVTIGDNFIELYLEGSRSGHTYRDMNQTIQLLGAYATCDLEVALHLQDEQNPGFGFEEIRYSFGPSKGWKRVDLSLAE